MYWQKKGFQASLFKGNYQKNVRFQAPSFQSGANPKSKIVRLNFDRLSYRADSELVELHAEVHNPKSGDHKVGAGLHKLLLRSDGLSVKPAPTNLHWQFNNSNEPLLKNWIFFYPFPPSLSFGE